MGHRSFGEAFLVLLAGVRAFGGGGNILRTPFGWLAAPSLTGRGRCGKRQKNDSLPAHRGASCPTTGSKSDGDMPTEAKTNPGTEKASINLIGWQQGRWPRGKAGKVDCFHH